MRPEDYVVGLFAELNPVPDAESLDVSEADEPLTLPDDAAVRQRSEPTIGGVERPRRTRWIAAVIAASMVFLAGTIPVVVFLSTGSRGSTKALDTVQRIHQAVFEGDWQVLRSSFAPDATWELVLSDRTDLGSMDEPAARWPSTFAAFDWDQDEDIDALDRLTSSEMMQYANGRTEPGRCWLEDTESRVTCWQPAGGAFWLDGNELYSGTWTYTFADGLISHVVFQPSPGDSNSVRLRAEQFRDWLEENRPDVVGTLFIPGASRAAAMLTPENLELFRELITQWQASAKVGE